MSIPGGEEVPPRRPDARAQQDSVFTVVTYEAGPAVRVQAASPGAATAGPGADVPERGVLYVVTDEASGRRNVIDPAGRLASREERGGPGSYAVAVVREVSFSGHCFLSFDPADAGVAARFALAQARPAAGVVAGPGSAGELLHLVRDNRTGQGFWFAEDPGSGPVPLGDYPAVRPGAGLHDQCAAMLASAGLGGETPAVRTARGFRVPVSHAGHFTEPLQVWAEFLPGPGGSWDYHIWQALPGGGQAGRAVCGVPSSRMRDVLRELHGQGDAAMTASEFIVAAARRGVPGMELIDISGVGYDPLPCGRLADGREFYLYGLSEAEFPGPGDPMPPLLGLAVLEEGLFGGGGNGDGTWGFLTVSEALWLMSQVAAGAIRKAGHGPPRQEESPQWRGEPVPEALARFLAAPAGGPHRALYYVTGPGGADGPVLVRFDPGIPLYGDDVAAWADLITDEKAAELAAAAPEGIRGIAVAGEFWAEYGSNPPVIGDSRALRDPKKLIRAITAVGPEGGWTAWKWFLEEPVLAAPAGGETWPGPAGTAALMRLAGTLARGQASPQTRNARRARPGISYSREAGRTR